MSGSTDVDSHSGSCHCGAVRFEVDGQLGGEGSMACNCSMCARAGTLLSFIPAERFRQTAGEEVLRDYQFGKRHIHHRFCSVCGIKPFADGLDPDTGAQVFAVNLRCVEGIDARAVLEGVHWYDGASL